MNVMYSKHAVKAISNMDKRTKLRMKAAFEKLPQGDIKSLKGSKCSYRLRVGGWRIIFSYPEENTALIEKIEPRGDVYKEV